jgi:hypothetical protein
VSRDRYTARAWKSSRPADPAHLRRGEGATVFLRTTGLETAPWNARLMQLTDPFGNRLRFNEDLK